MNNEQSAPAAPAPNGNTAFIAHPAVVAAFAVRKARVEAIEAAREALAPLEDILAAARGALGAAGHGSETATQLLSVERIIAETISFCDRMLG